MPIIVFKAIVDVVGITHSSKEAALVSNHETSRGLTFLLDDVVDKRDLWGEKVSTAARGLGPVVGPVSPVASEVTLSTVDAIALTVRDFLRAVIERIFVGEIDRHERPRTR